MEFHKIFDKVYGREYWQAKNRESIKKYDEAKSWRKTKSAEKLVEEFRAADSVVVKDGFYCYLFVTVGNRGRLYVKADTAEAVDKQPTFYYDLGDGWQGRVVDGEVIIRNANCGAVTIPENIKIFAEQQGIAGVDMLTLERQSAGVRRGYKVNTALGNGWSVFSPIRDNGICFIFRKDENSESYIA